MMSPNTLQGKQATKEENQSSGNGKTASTRPQEQAMKCPRCDSPNTKFCYYNNYSLTQPRHFCKTCRRYWTKGGALRNVPIGGGCRKNKKMKSSSRLSGDSKDSSGSSEIGGFKFFHGLSPAMDFNLGAVSVTSPCFSLDPSGSSTGSLMGFNYPLSSVAAGFSGAIHQDVGAAKIGYAFWREDQKDSIVSSVPIESQAQKPQPILFQNLEISKPETSGVGNSRREGGSGGDTATEWFFGNSFGQVIPTPANSNNNCNDNTAAANWNGGQVWGDLHQYNGLP
ncbi:hypothetical protein GH714_042359 [Hevea brasiliensis]|uniref:Dof zinc finger protein n=1 Tax=Hevea brasiliensis TaxID=3981 RepID=A0A6A6K955_HEVBR|nr:hypothetical protein GH714_042359 [Hevea brasiliensis]